MSNHSVIEHRANYHYFKMEEDYVEICKFGEQYPQCKAAILAVLEHWINDKRDKGQEEYIYMTYPEWIDALYGLFRRSTIIACLTELVREGLITRRPCKRYGKDTFEYTLNIKEVQKRLKELPERTEKNCRPNLNASKFKRVQKQTDVNLNGSTHPNLNGSEHEDASKSKRIIYSSTDSSSNIDSESTNADASHAHALQEEVTHRLEHPVMQAVSEEMVEQAEEELQQTPLVPPSPPADGVGGNRSGHGNQGDRPRASGKGKAQQQNVTQALSLQGAQVKEWMETIKGRKRRMTPKNIEAWNALAEEDEISFENLRDVIAEWEKSRYAKEHPDYVFDEQVLTRDGGGFTFEKGMDIVRRKRKKPTSTETKPKEASPVENKPLPVLAPVRSERKR